MYDCSRREHHAQVALAGTMSLLPLRDDQRLMISMGNHQWGIMMHFYHGLIIDTEFGVGLLQRIVKAAGESDLIQLLVALTDRLSPQRSHIYAQDFIGYKQIAQQIVESKKGVEHWYARSIMNLCELFVSMMERETDRKFRFAQQVVVFLRSAVRTEAMQTKQETPAMAEEQVRSGLAMLLLAAHKSIESAKETWC